MLLVQSGTLPKDSLLRTYEVLEGCHCDCFYVDAQGDADLSSYIAAFFGTWVFQLELKVLSIFGLNRDDAEQIQRLAENRADRMAAWHVEKRSERELLLAVGDGPIRTWLRIEPAGQGAVRMYFGSAMLPIATDTQGRPRQGRMARLALPLHKIYSRVLLGAALRKWNGAN